MKPFNQNSVIRGAIRRTFARAPVKQELLRENRKEFPKFNKDGSRSKKDAVCYLCAVCKEYRGSTKITVDHIQPVISIEDGFVDWNVFIERLYCGKENLQVICDDCHQVKTNKERFDRTFKKEREIIEPYYEQVKSHKTFLSDELTADRQKLLKTFTPKKLQGYPADFVEKVNYLKHNLLVKMAAKKIMSKYKNTLKNLD